MKRVFWGIALSVLLAGSANAALLSRAGGQAYYDTVLDITWLADANLPASNNFGIIGIDLDGRMSWPTANAWITAMNAFNYLGTNNWRLPTVEPVNGSTFNYTLNYKGGSDYGHNMSEQGTAYPGSTGSEMAHLFYNTLDNKSYCHPGYSSPSVCVSPQPGWGLTNTGPFSNIRPDYYWSGTTYAPVTNRAWVFDFSNGLQDRFVKSGSTSTPFNVWAVTDGDAFAVVPVPAAAWLLGGALGALAALRRRGQARSGG